MRRAVRTVIRLIAAGIILIGVMYLGLELARGADRRAGATGPSLVRILSSFLALAGGVALFATSSRLARRLTDDLDE